MYTTIQYSPSFQNYVQHLPPELISKITWFLSKKDAYQCMFVCKSWYTAALPVFYKSILINSQNLMTLGSRLIIEAKSDRYHPDIYRHGHLIRSIKIEDNCHAKFQSGPFLVLLLCHTPYLETLDLSYCLNVLAYWRKLANPAILRHAPHLKKIKLFSGYEFDSTSYYDPLPFVLDYDYAIIPLGVYGNRITAAPIIYHNYLESCYNFKKNIKHLEIHDINSEIHFKEVQYMPLESLKYFSQLTHLTISDNEADYLINDYDAPMNEITIMEYVLKHCNNLESFEFLHYFDRYKKSIYVQQRNIRYNNSWLDPRILNQLLQMESCQRHKSIVDITKETHILLPYILKVDKAINFITITGEHPEKRYTKLKTLTVVSSKLTLDQVNYISTNISSTNLQSLTIVVNRLSPLEWFNNIGFENAFNFAHYLSQIENLQLKFSEEEIIRCSILLSCHCSPIQEIWTRTLFWTFVDIIKGSRDMKYSIHLKVSPSVLILTPSTRLRLNETEKTIYLEQDITLNSLLYYDYLSQNESTAHVAKEVYPPDTIFLPQVAEKTSYLTINIPPSNCLREMEVVLQVFTQLRKLVIQAPSVHKGTRLEIGCSIEYENEMFYIENASHELRRATLTRMNLTPQFCDVFTKMLHHLTTLNLVDCDYFDTAGWISKKPMLDLRLLSSLKYLSMTIQTTTSSYNKVLVNVHYYMDCSSKPHCKRRFQLRDGRIVPPTIVIKKCEDKDTMILLLKVYDKLKEINFFKSKYRPLDAILN